MPGVEYPDPLAELADRIVQISRRIEPHVLGAVPLTATEATVLRWVHRHPDSSPSEAAEATALQRSNVSTALKGLEGKGMIERYRDADDARLVRLRLTSHAEEDSAGLNERWRAVLTEALDGDCGGVDEAVDLLRRIYSGLRGRQAVDG